MPKKRRKKTRKPANKKKAKQFRITTPKYIDISRNDLLYIAGIFLLLAFTSPPSYPTLGFAGTYFVLMVYMLHSIVFVVFARFVWEHFLDDLIKVRQLHLDKKEKML